MSDDQHQISELALQKLREIKHFLDTTPCKDCGALPCVGFGTTNLPNGDKQLKYAICETCLDKKAVKH